MKSSTELTTENIIKRFWKFAKKMINDIEMAEKIAKQEESENEFDSADEWDEVSQRKQMELMGMYEVIFGYFLEYGKIADLSKSYKRRK